MTARKSHFHSAGPLADQTKGTYKYNPAHVIGNDTMLSDKLHKYETCTEDTK